ncbi:transposase, IS605 OrfB family [Pyrobaculum islandicum DSM 4184]|uniref:Transposase, IS605 OrfB family n=1 Tax=Pyrobaculum islandicum (strain DSM 4184 / JCM 9189 / GEO3) TaxID=384616 RepID=A1RTF8_PYRIL|nr:RNA-guided endonuclease TnpB family protein [Pyrobaculum islandicum]ABL88240.1 transposase, IS605 OrfB family [Pyrobaculum islandicum DSM 4184]
MGAEEGEPKKRGGKSGGKSAERGKKKDAEKKRDHVLTRAVVIPSARLSWRKFNALKELEKKYRELRRRHPDLPSHYVYTAAQDAATRVKSFMALKREGKAKTEKPEIRRISIWLDDRLWKPEGYTAIRVSTHRGRITIPLWPTKQFWKHLNGGWRLKSQPRLKLDEKRRAVYVYFVFEKVVEERPAKGIIAVDLNENNVAVKAGGRVYILETGIRNITVGYHSRREVMQSLKGNRYTSRALKRNELNKKSDIRRKAANFVVREAERLGAAIAVENLPKEAPKNMISRVDDPVLRDRIYKAGFRSMLRKIIRKARERGIPVVKVNPRRTSSTCPRCGGGLARGSAPRLLRCPHCGREWGRDVAAVINIERRALEEGRVPPGPMPDDPMPEVAWLPMGAWARRKSLGAISQELSAMTA